MTTFWERAILTICYFSFSRFGSEGSFLVLFAPVSGLLFPEIFMLSCLVQTEIIVFNTTNTYP